jgi:hypothetical protein
MTVFSDSEDPLYGRGRVFPQEAARLARPRSAHALRRAQLRAEAAQEQRRARDEHVLGGQCGDRVELAQSDQHLRRGRRRGEASGAWCVVRGVWCVVRGGVRGLFVVRVERGRGAWQVVRACAGLAGCTFVSKKCVAKRSITCASMCLVRMPIAIAACAI